MKQKREQNLPMSEKNKRITKPIDIRILSQYYEKLLPIYLRSLKKNTNCQHSLKN